MAIWHIGCLASALKLKTPNTAYIPFVLVTFVLSRLVVAETPFLNYGIFVAVFKTIVIAIAATFNIIQNSAKFQSDPEHTYV